MMTNSSRRRSAVDQHWPLFAKAAKLSIPTIWHQGTTFPSAARLRWAAPLQLEVVAIDFPDLRIIAAHLGHPWKRT